jgi:EF hand
LALPCFSAKYVAIVQFFGAEGAVGRFLAGVASALLLVAVGIFIWRSQADAVQLVGAPPPATEQPLALADVSGPPEASEKTREQKRFSRYDRDKNGGVAADEYLLSRRKAYAKLDVNSDGKLSFDEYAIKTITKFKTADKDASGVLTPGEFLTTKVARAKPKSTACPPPMRVAPAGDDDEG